MKRFDGVFSSDRLPTKPRLLVCNTDPSDMPGEHRIAIYVDDYCACFCILRSSGVDMLRYLTDDTGLNDVVVHELICSIVR